MGGIHRIHTLCSNEADARAKTQQLYLRLKARGWNADTLRPLFAKATARAKAYEGPRRHAPEPTHNAAEDMRIFYHLQYHPDDPPSSALQRSWKRYVAQPPFSPPLRALLNHEGYPIGLERMIVAYKRPPNLGNLLSYRQLPTDSGPPVSSYRAETRNEAGPK